MERGGPLGPAARPSGRRYHRRLAAVGQERAVRTADASGTGHAVAVRAAVVLSRITRGGGVLAAHVGSRAVTVTRRRVAPVGGAVRLARVAVRVAGVAVANRGGVALVQQEHPGIAIARRLGARSSPGAGAAGAI